MSVDVMITIAASQTMEGEEAFVNELVTQGEYDFSEDKISFSYMESELTGLEGTETTFVVTQDVVSLFRSGSVKAEMIFCKGKEHMFLYETPYGALTMRIDTRRIVCGLGEDGGSLEIEYDIELENMFLSRNKFNISVKNQRGRGE